MIPVLGKDSDSLTRDGRLRGNFGVDVSRMLCKETGRNPRRIELIRIVGSRPEIGVKTNEIDSTARRTQRADRFPERRTPL